MRGPEHDRRLLYGRRWRWNPRNWSYDRRVVLPASVRARARLRVIRLRLDRNFQRMDALVERLNALAGSVE